jgi:hypothetical protein
MAVHGGEHQGIGAFVVGSADLGAPANQQLRDLGAAQHRRPHQRGPAVLAARVQVDPSKMFFHGRRIAAFDGDHPIGDGTLVLKTHVAGFGEGHGIGGAACGRTPEDQQEKKKNDPREPRRAKWLLDFHGPDNPSPTR